MLEQAENELRLSQVEFDRQVSPLLQTIVEPKYYLIIILLNVLGRDHEVADGRIVPVTNKPRQTFEGIRSCSGR